MSRVEIRQRTALEGQRAAGKGKRGGPPLHIGLAGALRVFVMLPDLLMMFDTCYFFPEIS